MKLVDFNSKPKAWDRYKAFHIHPHNRNGCIVQFETGEVMVRSGSWKPYERGEIKGMNFAVIHPNDKHGFKFALADGTDIPTAWVPGGFYVVDYDTKRVVPIGWQSKHPETRPNHLRSASVWFDNQLAPPQSLTPVMLSTPTRISKDEKSYVNELTRLCGVYQKINPYKRPYPWWRAEKINFTKLQEHMHKTPAQVFGEMTEEDKVRVALAGIQIDRTSVEHEYILIK